MKEQTNAHAIADPSDLDAGERIVRRPNDASDPDWFEQSRQAFAKRFTREHYGIDIDDCNQVYGD